MSLKTSIAYCLWVAVSIGSAKADDLWNLQRYELPNGQLDLKKLQQDYQAKKTQGVGQQQSSAKPPAKHSTTVGALSQTAAAPKPPAPPPPTTNFNFLLRKDFSDISLFSSPVDDKTADGAQFAWTQDQIAKVTTWTGTATAALAYTYFVEDIRNPFIGITIAPYLTVNREISTTAKQDVDTATFGLAGEVGRRSALFPNGSDYLRASGAAVDDELANTTVAHGALEWLPTYTWVAGTIPGTFLNYNFTPEIEADYDSTTVPNKTLLFSGKQESFRVGPEAKLWLKAVVPNGETSFWNSLYGSVSYHYWAELYSNRYDSWLDATLHYNLDPNGNVAVAFSYERGRTEDTGVDTNVYKVTLTAKTCVDLVDAKSC